MLFIDKKSFNKFEKKNWKMFMYFKTFFCSLKTDLHLPKLSKNLKEQSLHTHLLVIIMSSNLKKIYVLIMSDHQT